jgi:hypothetical protein
MVGFFFSRWVYVYASLSTQQDDIDTPLISGSAACIRIHIFTSIFPFVFFPFLAGIRRERFFFLGVYIVLHCCASECVCVYTWWVVYPINFYDYDDYQTLSAPKQKSDPDFSF